MPARITRRLGTCVGGPSPDRCPVIPCNAPLRFRGQEPLRTCLVQAVVQQSFLGPGCPCLAILRPANEVDSVRLAFATSQGSTRPRLAVWKHVLRGIPAPELRICSSRRAGGLDSPADRARSANRTMARPVNFCAKRQPCLVPAAHRMISIISEA